ncbi:hypothetical protein GLOIN_2v785153 [Rhizophagus clarus]|uniref:Uncharacterized protein n=1 Tax=Rhizophagus clarus TaxID=94130 RepID=A0A8H3QLU4_9GLOM|nr:hypothetical protein GLOIN_2v785153 [Rhizophagus clarus]
MDVAFVLFVKEYAKVIPIVFAYSEKVDEKTYIIAVLNLAKKSDVHVKKVPAKFKGFPVMIGYRHLNHFNNLFSGISIRDPTISSIATLGAFFKIEAEPEITIDHAVGEIGGSITQPDTLDNVLY